MKQKFTWKSFHQHLRDTGIHLIILSFLFAFLIWCYVIAGTNPIRSKDVDNVPLSLINTEELSAKSLTISGSTLEIPDTVSVKIEANVDSHKNISADNIRASVNLAEINSKGDITLNITATSSMSGVSIKSVSPARITLKIDNLIQREIPVTAELTGNANSAYHVSTPVLSQDTVLLSGPEEKLSQIVRAVCEIPIDNLTKNTRASYLLKLYDKNDQEVSLDQEKGDLPCVIADLKVLPTKHVTISKEDVIAAVTNIKPGYQITDVVIEPSVVEIAAEQSVLDSISTIRIQTINAEEADKSVMLDAALQLPENIEYISRTSVDVLVQISEIQREKTFKNQEIHIENLESGLKVKLKGKYTDVTLSGGKSAIDAISSSDIRIYVDMAGITVPGTYTRTIEMEEISGITKTSLTTEEVTVIVTK